MIEAAEALADPKAVILDTETTGLKGHMVEVAVIRMDGSVVINTLVRPPVPVEFGAGRVHGITDAELSGARVFGEVWNKDLVYALADRTVWAYNVEFDREVLHRDLNHAWPGKALEIEKACGIRYACIMELRTQFCGFRKRLDGGHRALGDCQAALELLKNLADDYDPF